MLEKAKRDASILITGFRVQGERGKDPSEELLLPIAADPPAGAACRALLLPPGREEALLKAIETMDHFLPDAVLVLGLAEGQTSLIVERVAINFDQYEAAGRRGRAARGELIDAAGPAGYFSTLPVQAMVERMRAGGVAARISNGGGFSLSNCLHYALMHYVALRSRETWFKRRPPAGLRSRVGSIGLPPRPQMDALAGVSGSSLDLETSLRGVRLGIDAIVEFLSSAESASAEPSTASE